MYDVFWDNRGGARLFLISIRDEAGPEALRIVTATPDGTEYVLAIAHLAVSEETGQRLCPAAVVRVPDAAEWLRIEPIISATGGISEFFPQDYLATFKFLDKPLSTAARDRSLWSVTSKSFDNLLRVTSPKSNSRTESASSNPDELMYESIVVGDTVIPGRLAGSGDPELSFEITLTRQAPTIEDLETFELHIAPSDVSEGLARPVGFMLYHLMATADVQPGLAREALKGELHGHLDVVNPEDRQGIGIALPFPRQAKRSSAASEDDPETSGSENEPVEWLTDVPWGFLDRLVIEAEETVEITFFDHLEGIDQPPRRVGPVITNTLVLAYYRDRFVLDQGSIKDYMRARAYFKRHDSERRDWTPHSKAARHIAEDLNANPTLPMPTAAAYVVLREAVLRRETKVPEVAIGKLPRSLAEFMTAPAHYFLLLDKEFFEATPGRPSTDLDGWLHATCRNLIHRRRRRSDLSLEATFLDQWIDTFRETPWTLVELIHLGAALDLAMYRIGVPGTSATSFMHEVRSVQDRLKEIHEIETKLSAWKYTYPGEAGLRTIEEALEQTKPITASHDALQREYRRAITRCRLYRDRREVDVPEVPLSDRPASLLADLAAEKLRSDLVRDNHGGDQEFQETLAKHFAIALDVECQELEEVASDFELKPFLEGKRIVFREEGTGFADAQVPYIVHGNQTYDNPRAREIDMALDELDALSPSEFSFVQMARLALIESLRALRQSTTGHAAE
ncbi:MAG: hypothetical protein AAGK02_01090 [Pseudomonadota bacterium]